MRTMCIRNDTSVERFLEISRVFEKGKMSRSLKGRLIVLYSNLERLRACREEPPSHWWVQRGLRSTIHKSKTVLIFSTIMFLCKNLQILQLAAQGCVLWNSFTRSEIRTPFGNSPLTEFGSKLIRMSLFAGLVFVLSLRCLNLSRFPLEHLD